MGGKSSKEASAGSGICATGGNGGAKPSKKPSRIWGRKNKVSPEVSFTVQHKAELRERRELSRQSTSRPSSAASTHSETEEDELSRTSSRANIERHRPPPIATPGPKLVTAAPQRATRL